MNPPPTEPTLTWASAWLERLCALDTTSGREDAGLPALRAMLAELGAEVRLQPVAPGRTNVLATWGEPRVMFSTHLDTVPPFYGPRWAGRTLVARGACDAKGQLAAQLGAVRALLDEGFTGLAWLGVVGEETDSAGAEAALALGPFPELRALVDGEPTELKLATGQRGVQRFELSCRGRAAHSGTPEEGRSAVWPLLDWLQALRSKPRPEDPELGPELWNLGRIQGGAAANVVPAEAGAEVLARTLPDSRFERDLRETAPPEAHVALALDEPPDRYPRIEGFEHAPMPFGSDAPRLRALVPDRTVVLAGPGSIRSAHTDAESLSLDDLSAGIDLNRRLAIHFLSSPQETP